MTNRRRAIKEVLALADECRKRRPVMGVHVDEYERTSHVRGGYWASTPERAIYCYTLENARAVQRILATHLGWVEAYIPTKKGARLTVASAKQLRALCTLTRAEDELVRAIADPKGYKKDLSAPRMQKKRAQYGIEDCQTCGAEIEAERLAKGRRYCELCAFASTCRMARRRELEKLAV